MDTPSGEQQPVQVIPQPSPYRAWRLVFRRYGISAMLAGVVFGIASLYAFLRQGSYALPVANRAFAKTAATLLGIVLLIGPMSRHFTSVGQLIQY